MEIMHFIVVLLLLQTLQVNEATTILDNNCNEEYCTKQDKGIAEYTAAVVEFSPVNSTSFQHTLNSNLKSYKEFILQAKHKGADIIVFPEYGLTTYDPLSNRSLARDYAQKVPSPKDSANPCDEFVVETQEQKAMHLLSCYAKESSIYVVVNLIEISCTANTDDCNKENELVYNTNVAFDRTGKLVARYRKFNLFGETAMNQTSKPEHSTFVADFGAKFGLITCFDIMFKSPAVTLVTEYHVTDIIFPTAWIQELPFLTAVQTQAAWSLAMQVNLLASGYNRPDFGSTGSGIYHRKLGALDFYMTGETGSKLLVAKVPVHSTSGFTPQKSNVHNLMTTKDSTIKNFNSIKLQAGKFENIKTCHGTICCELHYTTNNSQDTNSHYKLLAYDGYRTHAGGQYKSEMQVCALVACADDYIESCAYGFDFMKYTSNFEFSMLKLKGINLKSNRFIPTTLLSNTTGPIIAEHLILESEKVDDKFEINLSVKLSKKEPVSNIHTFGLFYHNAVDA